MEASDLALFDFTYNKEFKVGDLGLPSNPFLPSRAKAISLFKSLSFRLFICSASCPDFSESLIPNFHLRKAQALGRIPPPG